MPLRRRPARRPHRPPAAAQTLDARTLLAGTVNVFHHPRLLSLTGDAADNSVEVDINADGTSVTLTGIDTLLSVDGSPGQQSVTIAFDRLVTFRSKLH